MPEDVKAGTLAQEGGAGAVAPTGTPAQDGGDARDGADASEVEKLRMELEQQRSLMASWKSKVEAANQVLGQSGMPAGVASTSPTPTPAVDPDEALLRQLAEEYQQYPTAAGAYALRDAQSRIYAKQQQVAFTRFIAQGDMDIESSTDFDADTKGLAKELLRSGYFANAEAALWAARGKAGDKRVAAEAERERRDEAARQRVATAAHTATPGDAGVAPGPQKMAGRDYIAYLNKHEGSDAARRMIADVDNGKIVVDWDQL